MGEKIIVGPINKGLKTDRESFIIDNDSFPVLVNAYQWRGRIKRKRGTSFLGRLTRFYDSNNSSYIIGSPSPKLGTAPALLTLSGGAGNLITGTYSTADVPPVNVVLNTPSPNATIVPGSVVITDTISGNVYKDLTMDGVLTGTPSGSGTINYATGAITISGGLAHTIYAKFLYYPSLPVMGLEDLVLSANQFSSTLGFDTKFSYNILPTAPFSIYDVSFYKNPVADPVNLPGYVPKTTVTPTSWNGNDYQQIWSTNYQNAFWATNGITVPFTSTNVGMQYKPITTVDNITGGPPAIADLTITAHGLVVGDFVFINEVLTTTGINYQTGYVIAVVNANKVTVEFPNATIAGNGSGGIAQYLTNRSDVTKDCLRWYDGDPTDGSATAPVLNGHFGWVNFAPPLSNLNFSIDDAPEAQYYLVGARMIVPFKDYLLFFGPVIQTSKANSQIYLQDAIVFSQNGTPYYTASFTGTVTSTATVFHPMLVPTNQTATATAYFEDVTGFGGNIAAGAAQPITSVSPNEDVLIVGFTNKQSRLVFTGDGIIPFNFFTINSEYGSGSTFSTITLDRGVYGIGDKGIVITSQVACQRIDLEVPDQVFQFNLTNNGTQRVTTQRDFISEWVYFTYPSNQVTYKFPNQTLQYNYRDDSWAIFNEAYTTYGQFRKVTGYTWATIGTVFPTWRDWNEPWNAGASSLLQPKVIAGNQQGFVVFRENGTGESKTLQINNISGILTITNVTQAASAVVTVNNSLVIGQTVTINNVIGMTQLNGQTYTVTAASATTITLNVNSLAFSPYVSGGDVTPSVYSPDHCLNTGDYIIIKDCLGTIGSLVNGKIFSVNVVANDANNFFLNPTIDSGSFTYFGGGNITRMYVPFIKTKQFPVSWSMGRKTRIGPQMYLLSTTPKGQIQLQIYLSQQDDTPGYNFGPIVPSPNVINNTLVYSNILFTCPESTNLGLTPANVNLNMPTAFNQEQIWHRMNTSLLGDTVQVGFSMTDAQMRDPLFNSQFAEIELHAFILDVNPSQVLA